MNKAVKKKTGEQNILDPFIINHPQKEDSNNKLMNWYKNILYKQKISNALLWLLKRKTILKVNMKIYAPFVLMITQRSMVF